MKKRQSGSAHLVITVILVVSLLGALGFIYWQNFINKKDQAVTPSTSQSTTTPTNPTTPTTPATPVASGDLTISQWGVTMPAKGIIVTGMSGSNASVTTQAIIDEAKKINCSDSGIGTIYRTQSLSDIAPYAATSPLINGYYYSYMQPSQASCVDGQGNPAVTINQLMTDAEATLKAAMASTRAS